MKKNISLVFTLIFLVLNVACNKDDLSKITDIVIKASKNNVLVDEPIRFIAMGDNGRDVTNETVFYVNDEKIEGHVFSPSQAGIIKVKGIYKGIESNVLQISVKTPTGYTQKVLVEDYTGVWCGYCPRVAYAIEQIKANPDFGGKMIPVAIHLFSHNDPFTCADGTALKDAFNINGLPQGRINKTNVWTAPQPDHLDDVYNFIGGDAPLGIAINSAVTDGNIDVSVRVGFAQDFNHLGLVIYLLEDGLIHDQTNYTSYFGGAYTLQNFEHNDVLRKVYTDILGDPIPASQSVANHIYTYTLNAPLPTNVVHTDRLKLVVFVVDKTTNEAINVQSVHLGENQSFD